MCGSEGRSLWVSALCMLQQFLSPWAFPTRPAHKRLVARITMRAQFSSGVTIGALGILIIYAIYSAPTGIGPMLTAAWLIVMAIWFAKDHRKRAERAREQMKQHIARYYIDSSAALQDVIREALDKGQLGPSFDESREAWAARMHLNR